MKSKKTNGRLPTKKPTNRAERRRLERAARRDPNGLIKTMTSLSHDFERTEAMIKILARVVSFLIEERARAQGGEEEARYAEARFTREQLSGTRDLGFAIEGDEIVLALGDPRDLE